MAKTATSKKAVKKTQKSSSPKKTFLENVRENWFLSLLVVLFGITVLLVVVAQYKDWKNEKDLRALATTFETLPEELEVALGVPFTVEKGCSQTQEKFNDGVFICDIQVINTDASTDNQSFHMKINELLVENGASNLSKYGSSSIKFSLNGATCTSDSELTAKNFVSISCTPEIRKPNRQLASELFSEQ